MRNKFLLVVMMLFMAMGSAISAQSKTGGGGNPQPMQCNVRGMERTQIRLPFIS